MDRFTWGIVVGVVALVAVGIGAVAVTRGREAPPDLATPSGVALAFELAVDRGDVDTAWNMLAPSVQARTSRDYFLQHATNFQNLRGERQRIAVENAQVEGDTARVDVVRVAPETGGLFNFGGYGFRATTRLARVDGAWRVTIPSYPYLLPDEARFPS